MFEKFIISCVHKVMHWHKCVCAKNGYHIDVMNDRKEIHMTKILHFIIDRVTTKKGILMTIVLWLIAIFALTSFAPSAKDYEVSSVSELLPDHMESVNAEDKLAEYFDETEGTSAILVFEARDGEVPLTDIVEMLERIDEPNIYGLKEMIPFANLPESVIDTFYSEDHSALFVPLTFEKS